MSAFIVSGGAVLELGCPSSLNRGTAQQVSSRTTLGGKRKAFVRAGGRRSWDVSVATASPSEVSSLEAVARQLGMVGWYGPEAAIGNLLSPQASAFDVVPSGAVPAGLVALPDGTVAASVSATGTVIVGNAHGSVEMVPVRSGMAVTVGAWGNGGARFQGRWLDALGNSVGTYISPVDSHTGWAWRSYTVSPPSNAAFLDVQLFGGVAYALPSVAWGSVARPELGTGCPKALVHSPSFSPVALWEGANYTATGYQVVEVG